MGVNKGYIRTDLASESVMNTEETVSSGVKFRRKNRNGFDFQYMDIKTERASELTGKSKGLYITAEIGRVWLMGDEEKRLAEEAVAEDIRSFMPKASSVLTVGLGNRDITADALGPKTVDGLLVTRHIKEYKPDIFEKIGQREMSALCPGVVGQTGIETFELIEGAVKRVCPDLVIVIDALAARSVDRLATTVQISDTGIAPGSGIGNKRRRIDRESLGVPVLAVGVPTVVDSATLVYDALGRAGIEETSEELERVLENSRSFFVSLKESDVAVSESARLLANAINYAFRS
ncbi:MAG: GPR endopeptidase [Ruminococcaceae bacterium]|nr:GPR endopeptidase [Oscillospiraceae bacterium]